ncbi:unnamed protein product [Symbiodinium natans]|uniref:Uncharacterized protein n=1 Tax=Symbiodinium natans TaxID=878477 RepID=A0A812I0B2_9DINO|nr:unnamed protein product [Symbiodinium natans]
MDSHPVSQAPLTLEKFYVQCKRSRKGKQLLAQTNSATAREGGVLRRGARALAQHLLALVAALRQLPSASCTAYLLQCSFHPGILVQRLLSQMLPKVSGATLLSACITVRLRAPWAHTVRFAAGLGMPRGAPNRRSGTKNCKRSGCPLKAKKETGKDCERSSEKKFVGALPLARSLLRDGKGEHRQQSRRARTVPSSEGTTPFFNAWTPRCSNPCSPYVSEVRWSL